MRQREVISFSLPPDGLRALRKAVAREGIKLSEFIRDAVAQKLRSLEWKRIRRKGAETAKKYKISPEDVEAIVDEFRD